ncbi:peptidylprolyl isomerase [Peptoniphilaceae bacterium SGI.131]
METKVLVKYGDFQVTDEAVTRFIEQMGPQGAQFNNEEGKKQVATEMLNQHLIYIDAKNNGLESDPEYLSQVEMAKEQILRQISMQRVLDSVSVDAEEAKKFFEENRDRFPEVWQFQASHILVDDEKKAKELVLKVRAGEAFEDLAKDNSSCPSSQNGGDLGTFTSGQMVPEFETACRELEVGQISEPVKTQFGWHIIKLNAKTLVRKSEFESNQREIENILLGKKQQEVYLEKTKELQKKYNVEINF